MCAGLARGDVITSADGVPVADPAHLRNIVELAGPAHIRVEIMRAGKPLARDVTLDEEASEPATLNAS
jgi:S1-C subfamily serine protease